MEIRKIIVVEHKTKILIVDDDEQTRETYADVFRRSGYIVLEAKDGLEGLDIATKEQPDVMFTGIIMPRMDGFAMMEALNKNIITSSIPVVINSHLGREEDQKRAEILGAKDFIVRDFTTPREVVERVSSIFIGGGEYIFEFDPYARDAQRLARDLRMENYFQCPGNQKMVLRLHIKDPQRKTFIARLVCE